jgi:hypothetical protein
VTLDLGAKRRVALAFQEGALGFGFKASGFFSASRACRNTMLWRVCRLFKEFDEAANGVLAVGVLGSKAVGGNNDLALLGETASGDAPEADEKPGRQGFCAACVEAQLRRARNFIDILPAGSAGANESERDVALVDGEIGRNGNHSASKMLVRKERVKPIAERLVGQFDVQLRREGVFAHVTAARLKRLVVLAANTAANDAIA